MTVQTRYFTAGFLYGFGRTLWHMHGTSTYDYDWKNMKVLRPPLITEKCVIATANGLIGLFYSPFFVIQDMCRLEKKLRTIPNYDPPTVFFWTFHK